MLWTVPVALACPIPRNRAFPDVGMVPKASDSIGLAVLLGWIGLIVSDSVESDVFLFGLGNRASDSADSDVFPYLHAAQYIRFRGIGHIPRPGTVQNVRLCGIGRVVHSDWGHGV